MRFWLGISLMQIENWEGAIEEFREAGKDQDKYKQCQQYIRYVRGEMRRLEELQRMERELARMG